MRKAVAAARAHSDDRARRAALLRWYGRHRRDLPWRRARDPYAIWVSEIMLQQTRVETVVPYYERFLDRFPTVHALARAPESSVLAAWSGLGYYRRARNLRDAAALVARDHGGALPRDPEALRALPGIGAYTAAAIASIAFGRPAAAVDGNVIRVIARWDGRRGRRDDAALRRAVTARAESLAPGRRPGDWTQALMELGATLCLPRDPLCERCPVARWCRARRGGRPDRYPEGAAKGPPKREHRVLLLVRRGSRILLLPDPSDAGATWAPPSVALPEGGAPRSARAALALAQAHGGDGPPRGPVRRFRHRTYAHDWTVEVWEVGAKPRHDWANGRWATRAALAGLPVRAPTVKALKDL
ncbi:MAG TPA: A/G-specific adenine glycosylase [Candidatus Eisenbacteria bacterium]|nr:A/G-specific adenine glycosylase [Candidatus Eisenbacteria bacterium]